MTSIQLEILDNGFTVEDLDRPEVTEFLENHWDNPNY
jgi:hypothetical protein